MMNKTSDEILYYVSVLRKKLNLNNNYPIDLFKVIEEKTDIIVIKQNLNASISGMCFRDDKVIVINSSSTKGRQNFTLAHELYHMYFDKTKNVFTCGEITANKDYEENEQTANFFASYFLAPNEDFMSYAISLKDDSFENIIYKVSNKFGFSIDAANNRLKKLELYKNYSKKNCTKKFYKDKGLDVSLYEATKENNVNKNYLELVDIIYNKELISDGKRKEFLADAFIYDK